MMETRHSFTADTAGLRLDKAIASQLEGISRARIQRLIEQGLVRVNSLVSKPSYRLDKGDEVVITIPEPEPSHLIAQKIPIQIIYEDKDILVVDKPAGLSVHPGPGHPDSTLVNAVLGYAPQVCGGEAGRPGIVHRLDKDTSGLIIIALNPESHVYLANQFKTRQVKKTYTALVRGNLAPATGFIDAPIGRDRSHRKKMAVTSAGNGRLARTGYRVMEYISSYTLLQAMPETGRTHQIRVHLAAIGHPILGDTTYGFHSNLLSRQFLHASSLIFKLPSSGDKVEFSSPLPQDLEKVIGSLRS